MKTPSDAAKRKEFLQRLACLMNEYDARIEVDVNIDEESKDNIHGNTYLTTSLDIGMGTYSHKVAKDTEMFIDVDAEAILKSINSYKNK